MLLYLESKKYCFLERKNKLQMKLLPPIIERTTAIAFLMLLQVGGYSQQRSATPLESSVLIFPLQDKHVHGSTIVGLPNGDMLAAWFYGSGERKEDDVKIMGARLTKGAKQWSPPFLMADT